MTGRTWASQSFRLVALSRRTHSSRTIAAFSGFQPGSAEGQPADTPAPARITSLRCAAESIRLVGIAVGMLRHTRNRAARAETFADFGRMVRRVDCTTANVSLRRR